MSEFLNSTLGLVSDSPELTVFFKRIWEKNSKLAKMFMLHREELFLCEKNFTLPLLFWSNVLNFEGRPTSLIKVAAELGEARREQAVSKLGFEDIFSTLRDMLAYGVIKVIRANEDLKKLILTDDFSFEKMKETLRDYENISLDVLDEFGDMSRLEDEGLRAKVQKLSNLKWLDLPKVIEILPSMSTLFDSLPVAGINLPSIIVQKIGMKHEEYADTLTTLFSLKLITCLQTTLWCEECVDEPQVFKTTSNIDPDRLDMKCPRCRTPMLVCSAYKLNSTLKDCILWKDGLLTVCLGYLFNQKGVKWKYSVQGEFENDFIIQTRSGEAVLECKMHLLPKDLRSFRGGLEQDVSRFLQHLEVLEKEGKKVTEAYLVYNYDLEPYFQEMQEILDETKFSNEVKRYKLRVVEYGKVPDIVGTITKQ